MDLWPPIDSPQSVEWPPLGDLANHRNHYVGPAKSTWPNLHHGLIPDRKLMKITDFITWVEPNGPRNSSIFIFFQKADNLWTIYKTRILQFRQGFPLFWAPWISLWPRFSPLRFQENTKKHPCENTCISENINITKVISTSRPLKIITQIHTFFHYLSKPNLSQNQQKIKEKRCFPKT